MTCGLFRSIGDWECEFQWLVNRCKGKSLLSTVLRIAWGAMCYHLWQERNRRYHGGPSKEPKILFEFVADSVRFSLNGIPNIKGDYVNTWLKHSWRLSIDFA